MRIVIFDIDGTLANCEHRLHHIHTKPKRFDRFERDIPLDTLIEPVADVYRRYIADPDVTVFLLTGRNDTAREMTTEWLTKYDLDGYELLFMKPRGKSFMPDTELKEMILDNIIESYGAGPEAVFEDRARVVDMWKRRGIFVFNVDQ